MSSISRRTPGRFWRLTDVEGISSDPLQRDPPPENASGQQCETVISHLLPRTADRQNMVAVNVCAWPSELDGDDE